MFTRPTQQQRLFRESLLKKQRVPQRRSQDPAPGRGRPWWRLGGLWILFGGVALWGLVYSPWLVIETVKMTGESSIPAERIQAVVWESLRGRWWHILPRDNLLFAPTRMLAVALETRYPKFSHAEIRRVFPETLVVELAERPLLVEWCSAGPCYLIRDGRVLPSVADIPEYASARLSIIDRSGLSVEEGQVFSGSDLTDFFGELWEAWPKEGQLIAPEAETPSRHSAELRLRTPAGFEIWVATDRLPAETIAAWELIRAQALRPEIIASLAVVDLRTEGRAYLRTRTVPESETVLDTRAAASPEKEKPPAKDKSKKREK